MNKTLLIIAVFFLFSCSSNPSKEVQNTSNDTIKEETSGFGNNESTYYRFPTPDEIFSFIDNKKLKFNPEYLNPVSNVNTYLDSKSQTLALGTYISDLAYITMFKSYNKSAEYYNSIHILSEKVRISFAYDLEISKKIEKNLLNLDSLKNISSDSYSSIVEYLIVNNREKTLALIATGSYVECFYIAFQLVGNYSNNNPMITKIVDLKYAFENLYSYLQIYSDNEDVKYIAEMLVPMNKLFKQFDEKDKSKTTVKQDKSGNIVITGGTSFEMNKELFEKLRTEVSRVRNTMVGKK